MPRPDGTPIRKLSNIIVTMETRKALTTDIRAIPSNRLITADHVTASSLQQMKEHFLLVFSLTTGTMLLGCNYYETSALGTIEEWSTHRWFYYCNEHMKFTGLPQILHKRSKAKGNALLVRRLWLVSEVLTAYSNIPCERQARLHI